MKKELKEPKIITLDTETYGLTGELKRIAIYDGSKVYYGYKFTDIEHILINYSSYCDVHVYIHNIEFDLRKIPEVFDRSRVQWKKCLLINGKLATLSCRDYTMHDSFKILPMPLEELSGTKGFNVEHGKLDLWEAIKNKYGKKYKDKGDYFIRCDKDDGLYLEYLGYDVISLYEVLQKLLEISKMTLDAFVRCVSTSSLSRYIFKHGYGNNFFAHKGYAKSDYEMMCSYKWTDDLELENCARMAYCGGRVEVFKPVLNHKGYHYDVNSLYPYVMLYYKLYPIGKPRKLTKPLLVKKFYEDWKLYHNGLGIIQCEVYVPPQPIPPLPVKITKLTFPTGKFYGAWTYEELEYAEKECGVEIIKFYASMHFNNTFPVFENFIGAMYGLKEEGNKTGNIALRTFGKLLMNVGYGYTGMRRDDKTSLDDYNKKDQYDDELIVYGDESIGLIEIMTDIKAPYIQVPIAAHVTSRARLVLLKAMRKIIDMGGNIYYCDTDSIVTDIQLPSDMVDDTRLGAWDLESEPERALFLRPKVYVETVTKEEKKKDNIKFKGVTKDTQKTLNYHFYEGLLKTLQKGDKKSVLIEKNKTVLRSIIYMQKHGIEPLYFEKRDKEMNLKTTEKRNIDYNNNKTWAHHFDSIEDYKKFRY